MTGSPWAAAALGYTTAQASNLAGIVVIGSVAYLVTRFVDFKLPLLP